MEFMTSVTTTSKVLETSRRHVLAQTMKLNRLTWIVSLDLTKQ